MSLGFESIGFKMAAVPTVFNQFLVNLFWMVFS